MNVRRQRRQLVGNRMRIAATSAAEQGHNIRNEEEHVGNASAMHLLAERKTNGSTESQIQAESFLPTTCLDELWLLTN